MQKPHSGHTGRGFFISRPVARVMLRRLSAPWAGSTAATAHQPCLKFLLQHRPTSRHRGRTDAAHAALSTCAHHPLNETQRPACSTAAPRCIRSTHAGRGPCSSCNTPPRSRSRSRSWSSSARYRKDIWQPHTLPGDPVAVRTESLLPPFQRMNAGRLGLLSPQGDAALTPPRCFPSRGTRRQACVARHRPTPAPLPRHARPRMCNARNRHCRDSARSHAQRSATGRIAAPPCGKPRPPETMQKSVSSVCPQN